MGKGINFYSIEKEIALGKSLAQEIEQQAKMVEDPIVTEYINRLGQNLVRNSDSKVPFTVKVIDAEEINAFALPGGYLFVNSGLILTAETEAELAGVMAHEIAHVAARHGTRQATRGGIANLATIPLIFMGGWGGYGARQAVGVLIPVGFLRFSRAFEREADFLGLQYLYKTGYDPASFIDFFERIQGLERKKPGTLSRVFSTHPLTNDRIAATQKDIQGFDQKPEYVITTSEFSEVRAKLTQTMNRRKPEDQSGRPTLRKNPSDKIDPADDGGKDKKKDEDERPTLKRR